MTQQIRVLYAEDNARDSDLTRLHFEAEAPEFGFEVVQTGARCLKRLKEDTYDILLLDHHLPDMEGLEMLKSLRQQGADLPVVMVTGAGDEELAIRMLGMGVRDYVPKNPGYLKTLPATLREVLARQTQRRNIGLASGSVPRLILYVEHDSMDVELTQRALAKAAPHLSLVIVPGSREALEILGTPHQFDLVLADLQMEDMSGLDLLREATRRGILVPFILMTGRGDEGAAVSAMKLGAYDYVVKRGQYLAQLPFVIENAIWRFRLDRVSMEMGQQIAERTRQVEEVNAEMESFAHSVSHDLRAPLRAMTGFAQALVDDYADKLDAGGADMAHRIVAAAAQMDRLTLDLLEYSRITIKEMSLTAASLEEALDEALGQLQESISQSGARVTVETPLPSVRAHRTTLAQVIANLLSNAIKFIAPGVTPQVRVLAQERDGWVRLWVHDNGIGIAPEDQSRIFGIFERLHGQESYPGTGIGLAIVRRGIGRMGGRFGVESRLGEGSRFWIELPGGKVRSG